MAAVDHAGRARRPPQLAVGSTVRRALFGVAGAATLLAVLLTTAAVLVVRHSDQEDALYRADRLVRTLANEVVGPRLDSADPRRSEVLGDLLGSRTRDGSIERVKIWTPEGEVVWADDARLVGRRYSLAPQDRALAGTTDAYASLTDLERPENEFEQQLAGTYIEVYAGFFDRAGRPLVFEAYLPAGELDSGLFEPQLLGLSLAWLVVLLAVLLPVAAWLAHRVDRAQAEHQRLLEHAVEASELERKRLAADLHDGVIQDLAGVGYVFSALEAQLSDQPAALATARKAAEVVRADVLALRALSTDLYPPDLGGEGLEAALDEMLEQLEQEGLRTELLVGDRLDLPRTTALVAYRVVREALRNVVKHAAATKVVVEVERSDDRLLVQVVDDGTGFDPAAAAPQGHLGLRVLRDSVTDVQGELELCSVPGRGTRVRAQLPVL